MSFLSRLVNSSVRCVVGSSCAGLTASVAPAVTKFGVVKLLGATAGSSIASAAALPVIGATTPVLITASYFAGDVVADQGCKFVARKIHSEYGKYTQCHLPNKVKTFGFMPIIEMKETKINEWQKVYVSKREAPEPVLSVEVEDEWQMVSKRAP